MKPLSEMAADAKGVIFDVDDTVTRDGRLERVAFDAMWSLADAGFTLVAVTGRPLGWADVIARHWPVRVAVGENGAGWSWVHAGRFHTAYFRDEPSRTEDAERVRALWAQVQQRFPGLRVADDQGARRCDLAIDVGERERVEGETLAELVQMIEAAGCRAPVSSVHCHIVPAAWDKASGSARAIADVLGQFDAAEWVFVGDSGNDDAAFGGYARSVGVANVRNHLDRLVNAPAYVTQASHGAGFAELAQHLLAHRSVGS